MGLLANIKEKGDYKRYLKTLSLSTALAVLTLYIAFGLMFFAPPKENTVPGWFILLTLAISFIISTAFYESRLKGKGKGKEKTKEKSKDSLKPLIKGLFLGICATYAFVAVIGGVKFMLRGSIQDIGGIEVFISALAICMIVSMVFLSLLRPSSN